MKQQLIEDLKKILPIHNWAYWGNTPIAVTQRWDYKAIAEDLRKLGYCRKDDMCRRCTQKQWE